MAAVFCASLSRRAMVCRSRVIFTRSSRAASSAGDGARTCTAAAGCATGVGCAAARSIAANMSPLVTRPSLPVPDIVDGSIPVSAAILRTDGAKGLSAAGAAAGAGAGFGGAGGGADCAVGCGAAFAGAAPAPSLIWPSTAPTATVSPSLAAISPSTPAAGAGTSIVTLSVSSSTSGSSTATASPGFLNHLPMVASVTDSPSVGTRISAMVCFPPKLSSSAKADDPVTPASPHGAQPPRLRLLGAPPSRGMTIIVITPTRLPETASTAPDAATSVRPRSRPTPAGRCSARGDAWRRSG